MKVAKYPSPCQSFSSSFPSSFIDFPFILAISPFWFPGLSRFQPPNVHQDESPNATPWALPRSHPATIYQMHCVVTSVFVLITSNSCSIFMLRFYHRRCHYFYLWIFFLNFCNFPMLHFSKSIRPQEMHRITPASEPRAWRSPNFPHTRLHYLKFK